MRNIICMSMHIITFNNALKNQFLNLFKLFKTGFEENLQVIGLQNLFRYQSILQ